MLLSLSPLRVRSSFPHTAVAGIAFTASIALHRQPAYSCTTSVVAACTTLGGGSALKEATRRMVLPASSPAARSTVRVLINGGDNMLGRAIQLTFPVQAAGEEQVTDSMPAKYYLELGLNHDSDSDVKPTRLTEIRDLNKEGRYLWGEYLDLQMDPPPDLRILNLETAVTESLLEANDVPEKGINYHMHIKNVPRAFSAYAATTHQSSSSSASSRVSPATSTPIPSSAEGLGLPGKQETQEDILTARTNARASPYVVSFSNNHALDWGRAAFEKETLPFFRDGGLPGDGFFVGAGRDIHEAMKPVTIFIAPSTSSNQRNTEGNMVCAEGGGNIYGGVGVGSAGGSSATSGSGGVGAGTVGNGGSDDVVAGEDAISLVKIFAVSSGDSGTPSDWGATHARSGIVYLPELNSKAHVDEAVNIVARMIKGGEDRASEAGRASSAKTNNDQTNNNEGGNNNDTDNNNNNNNNNNDNAIIILSIHWGPNWAFRYSGDGQTLRQVFAQRVIDELGVCLVYGHSSHHVRGLEVYKGKLIIYGAGDFINDYEGFENRGDEKYVVHGAAFVIDVERVTGDLAELRLVPYYMDRLRLRRLVPGRSKVWSPPRYRLVIEDETNMLNFINRMSEKDAGQAGSAVSLQYRSEDPSVEGGPLFFYTKGGEKI